jgi:hypothetical protein
MVSDDDLRPRRCAERLGEHARNGCSSCRRFRTEARLAGLFSLLLVVGLLIGEWMRARFGWPKVIGYVLAGTFFGPALLGWISIEALAQARPVADAALGLLMLEIGRRLDLRWLLNNRDLLRGTLADITFPSSSSTPSHCYRRALAGLGGRAAAVTMASAPAVVLLTVEESNAQGQVTERIILHTALSAAASFVVFAVVLGVVHAEQSDGLAQRRWSIRCGSRRRHVDRLAERALALLARPGLLPKRSLAQVFILVACACSPSAWPACWRCRFS